MDNFSKSTKAESEPPLNIGSKNDENVLDDASENNKNGSETEYNDAEDKEIGIEKYRDESKKAHQLIVKERIKNSSETEESKRAKKEEPEPLPFIPLEPPPKPRQDEFQFQHCEMVEIGLKRLNKHIKKDHDPGGLKDSIEIQKDKGVSKNEENGSRDKSVKTGEVSM